MAAACLQLVAVVAAAAAVLCLLKCSFTDPIISTA